MCFFNEVCEGSYFVYFYYCTMKIIKVYLFVCMQKVEEMIRTSKPSDKRQDQTGDAFLSLLKPKGICYQLIQKVH